MAETKSPKVYRVDVYCMEPRYVTGDMKTIKEFYNAANVKATVTPIEIGHVNASDVRNKSLLESMAKKWSAAISEAQERQLGK